MVVRDETLSPYRAEDGDTETLYSFLREAAKILDGSFDPPEQIISSKEDDRPYIFIETKKKVGSDAKGFELVHRIEFEPKYGGHAYDKALVKCYGLPDNTVLEISCTRDYQKPRYLTIRVGGSASQVKKVIGLFHTRFKAIERLTDEEVKAKEISAYAAIRRSAWQYAEENARLVLGTDPESAKALFCLGVARAAQGDLREGEEYLRAAIDKDPTDYDAYYNLGLVYKNKGQIQKAVDLYHQGLDIDPENHPLLYQLAAAYEEMGNPKKALHYYKEAVRTSPNPGGAFHYTGMDFTTHAERAIERLEQS